MSLGRGGRELGRRERERDAKKTHCDREVVVFDADGFGSRSSDRSFKVESPVLQPKEEENSPA